MEQYVSVDEFSRLSGKSGTYIRRICREGKVPYIMEQLQNSTTQKYMIDISSPEAQKHILNKSAIPEHPEQSYKEVPQPTNETIIELTFRIEELSKQAGKVELLEDIKKREQENTKFWQDKYFELQNQVTELNIIVAELKAENERFKQELKKPFWKKNLFF